MTNWRRQGGMTMTTLRALIAAGLVAAEDYAKKLVALRDVERK